MSGESTYQPPRSILPTFILGLVLIALFLIGSKALISLSAPIEGEDAARSAERTAAYAKLIENNHQRLSTYAILDKQAGSVQIPIHVAMSLAEERLNAKEPAPANPINPLLAPPPATPNGDATTEPAVGAKVAPETSQGDEPPTGEGTAVAPENATATEVAP